MVSMGTTGVFARRYEELDRPIEVGFAGGRVIAVSFPPSLPGDATDDHELLDRIGRYLGGDPDDFGDLRVALTVPTDRRRVLETLRDVGYGTSLSVSRLARSAGLDENDPDDLTLVTDALSANPIPLLFPDHRVDGGPYATPSAVRTSLRAVEGL